MTATTMINTNRSDKLLQHESSDKNDNTVVDEVAQNNIIRDINGKVVTDTTKYYWIASPKDLSTVDSSNGMTSFDAMAPLNKNMQLVKNPLWKQTDENQAIWQQGGQLETSKTEKSSGIQLPSFISNFFSWIMNNKVLIAIFLIILAIILL